MDIQPLYPVISAVISGLGGAGLAWKLKSHSEERAEIRAAAKALRLEFEQTYEQCYALFEQAIAEVRSKKSFSLAPDFSRMNARISLKAPDNVSQSYFAAAIKLEEWSVLFSKSQPKQYSMGEATVTILQSPDPRQQFVEAEKNAYEALCDSLQKVVEVMRDHIVMLS